MIEKSTFVLPEERTVGWVYNAKCWQCGNHAALEQMFRYDRSYSPDDPDWQESVTYDLLRCPSCGFPTVLGRLTEYPDETWVVPLGHSVEDFPDVPESIANAASETVQCLSAGLLRSAQLMARATVEAVCKDKGETTGTLANKILKLYDKGVLHPLVRDEVTEIRHAGNDMAHGDFLETPDELEVKQTVQWMRLLLQDVYQRPAAAQRGREAREAAKRAKHLRFRPPRMLTRR